MKKRILLGVIVLLLGLFPTVIFAQGSGLPGSGWLTGEQIQNVGTGTATVGITVYDVESGGATHTGDFGNDGAEDTLAPGASLTYLPNNFPSMPDGFVGSAVVSSTEPIVGIVNQTNESATMTNAANAQYRGASDAQTSPTLNFPLAKANFLDTTTGNFQNTAFYIQNAGSAAATINATFRRSSNGEEVNFSSPAPIEPNRMWVVILGSHVPGCEDGNSNPNRFNCLGSLTVNSSQNLAGVVNEYLSGTNTFLMSTRGFGSQEADTTVYAPLLKQRFRGNSTGLQVQNTGAAAADITMNVTCTFPPHEGETFSVTAENVPPGSSATFFNGLVVNPAGNSSYEGINDCAGGATFTANPGTTMMVGIVNEQRDSGPMQAATYSMTGAGQATQTIAAPLYKEDFRGRRSGFQIQNTSNSAATVDLVFQLGAFGETPTSYTLSGVGIPANRSITCLALRDQPTCFGASPAGTWAGGNQPQGETLGGVTVTSNQPVVAIMQEEDHVAANGVADMNNYEGFNLD